MRTTKTNRVNWQALERRICDYQAGLHYDDRFGQWLFSTTMDEGRFDPAPVLDFSLPQIEQAMLDGRTQDALEEVGCVIVDLCARVSAMALAMGSAKPKVFQVVRTTKKLREAAMQNAHPQEQIDRAVRLYRRLLKKDPTRKKSAVESEVKRITDIPPRTLRYHLKKSE